MLYVASTKIFIKIVLIFFFQQSVYFRPLVLKTLPLIGLQLRNRKHFPCFYRVIETRVEVWENEKCCGNTSCRRVFPQLFRVLPNLHKCFYNSIETRRKCFLFLLENSPRKITKKRRKLDSFIYHQNVDSLHHAMYTSFKFKLLCVSIEL